MRVSTFVIGAKSAAGRRLLEVRAPPFAFGLARGPRAAPDARAATFVFAARPRETGFRAGGRLDIVSSLADAEP
jgi:hypothetical protein